MTWQPIETAPTEPIEPECPEGIEILVWVPGRYGDACFVAHYCSWPHGKAGWFSSDSLEEIKPTHWMPLPEPPDA